MFYYITVFPSSYHREIVRSNCQWQKWCPCTMSMLEVKGRGHRCQNPTKPFPDNSSIWNSHTIMKLCSKLKLDVAWERCPIGVNGRLSNFNVTWLNNRRFRLKLGVSGLLLQFEFTGGYTMMHNAWSSIWKVPYLFSRSSVKFRGHTGHKIADFDPNWAFPDCNPSLNSPMALNWYTQLDVVQKRFPIIFWGNPSNFKAAQTLKNQRFESYLSKITRPDASIKSLRFALLQLKLLFLIKSDASNGTGHITNKMSDSYWVIIWGAAWN